MPGAEKFLIVPCDRVWFTNTRTILSQTGMACCATVLYDAFWWAEGTQYERSYHEGSETLLLLFIWISWNCTTISSQYFIIYYISNVLNLGRYSQMQHRGKFYNACAQGRGYETNPGLEFRDNPWNCSLSRRFHNWPRTFGCSQARLFRGKWSCPYQLRSVPKYN